MSARAATPAAVLAIVAALALPAAAPGQTLDKYKAWKAATKAARSDARRYSDTTDGFAGVTALPPCRRRSRHTAACPIVYLWSPPPQGTRAGCHVHETFTVTLLRSGHLRVRGTRALWRAVRCDGGRAVLAPAPGATR